MPSSQASDTHNQEWARLLTDPDLDDLEVLHAHYINHRFSPHVHEEYGIGVIEYGVEYLGVADRKPLKIAAGSIVTLNPGELHDGYANDDQGWTYRMLYPSVRLVRNIVDDALGVATELPYFPEAAIQDKEMFGLVQSAHRVLMNPASSRLRKQALTVNMLALLVSRFSHQKPAINAAGHNRASVLRALEYIDAHFDESIALDTISSIAGLSRFHFCRAFRSVVGIPPHAYQTHRRIEASKKMIRAGVPLANIAAETGFFDQSHLGRHFKRIVGVSPGAYAA